MVRTPFAAALVVMAFAAFSAGSAVGTSQRTFASVSGNDGNACSITAPCRSLGAAVAQTAAGGEVIIVDSGGYGPVTITKPVSVTAPAGVYAGVSVFTGTGIVVNPISGVVTLTGLTVNGLGGAIGISYQSGTALRLNRMVVSGFTSRGLVGNLTASGTVSVRDSVFTDNSNIGAELSTSSGILMVNIQATRFEKNHIGANFTDNVVGVIEDTSFTDGLIGAYIQAIAGGATNKVTIHRCTVSGNTDGFLLGYPGAATTTVQVRDSVFTDNTGTAAIIQGGATYFSNTSVSRNGFGISLTGMAISFGDNLVYANGGEEVFSSTLTKK